MRGAAPSPAKTAPPAAAEHFSMRSPRKVGDAFVHQIAPPRLTQGSQSPVPRPPRSVKPSRTVAGVSPLSKIY